MVGLFTVLSFTSLVGCGSTPKSLEPTQIQPTAPSVTPTLSMPMPSPTVTEVVLSEKWIEGVSQIVWVAYSPPSADPNQGTEATPKAINEDLTILRKAGFTGLVTYSSAGTLGRELPVIAEMLGFKGLIMGIWDPSNQEEIDAAEAATKLPIVLGFCIGNEGLNERYEMAVLSLAIQNLREATGKPATTTEQIDDYVDENLLQLGDWVFPNAHPYFHNQLDPDAAVRWTQTAYDDFKRRTDHFVMFKEVGLPTAGDPEGRLNEASQEGYYLQLAKTDVRFVYFEAFDQPWKTTLPIEPHWGIFRSDLTPKLLGLSLMGLEPTPSPTLELIPSPTAEPAPSLVPEAFYIYQDADSPDNHFKPSGYMGDVGDVHINEAFKENPHSGKTCIRIVYDAKGQGPNECPYPGPCKWAGVYWQEPPNNWGKDEIWKDRGYNLSDYNRLIFWARTDRATTSEFKVGGIDATYGDSLLYPRGINTDLTEKWQEFEIDLTRVDLTYIIGGFLWVTNWDMNPNSITFYLDDIRFESK